MSRRFPFIWLMATLLCAVVPAALAAGEKSKAGSPEETQQVEVFAAIEQGLIEVRVIPRDATQCRLLVHNKTDRPLSVELPQAFAAVPVLAQGRIFGG